MRWISDQWRGWYFERMDKDSYTWIEYVNSKPFVNLTQYSIDNDVNGYAIVVLRYDIYKTILKLTEGMTYYQNNLTDKMIWRINNLGYWAKKNGKKYFCSRIVNLILQ